jgi:thiol-disulfide isomerase/thioredoxin
VAQTPQKKKKPPVATPARAAGGRNVPPARRVGGRPAGLFTWVAVGLVVVVVATLVVIKVTSGGPSSSSGTWQATDPATVAELTQVPASVFNTVGIKSTVSPVYPPIVLKDQPLLTATSSTGATLPEVLYVGAEWCPYCAAERWAMIIALSRFGTFSGLGNVSSSSSDVYPNTPTFSFAKSKFTSPYLVFKPVEMYNNVINPATNYYTRLQKLTSGESEILAKYESAKYVPGFNYPKGEIAYPFLSFGDQFLISGPSYTPAILQGQSRSQIATGLSDPTSPITQAIIASANYLTATLCGLTKDQPASVCTSPGVLAAKKALHIQ